MAGDLGFEEAEKLLRSATFEDCRALWYSSNYVYIAQMCGPSGEQFAAVYKPLRGERPLWDFPEGCLYKREAAAYELSKLLQWPFIPPTVVRDGPEGVGSLQVYIQHDPESHFFVQRERPELVPQLQRICLFDAVANNADRKGGHCLLDEHGRIWGIDHGLCFHTQYKLRSVIWDWAQEPAPQEWLDQLDRTRQLIASGDDAAQSLVELLQYGEKEALLARMRRTIEQAKFPAPGPNRHYPWPLV